MLFRSRDGLTHDLPPLNLTLDFELGLSSSNAGNFCVWLVKHSPGVHPHPSFLRRTHAGFYETACVLEPIRWFRKHHKGWRNGRGGEGQKYIVVFIRTFCKRRNLCGSRTEYRKRPATVGVRRSRCLAMFTAIAVPPPRFPSLDLSFPGQ